MRHIILENTDLWRIDRYGGGVSYTITRKSDGASVGIQGDDALEFETQYDQACHAFNVPGTVQFRQSWNMTLTDLAGDLIPEAADL